MNYCWVHFIKNNTVALYLTYDGHITPNTFLRKNELACSSWYSVIQELVKFLHFKTKID